MKLDHAGPYPVTGLRSHLLMDLDKYRVVHRARQPDEFKIQLILPRILRRGPRLTRPNRGVHNSAFGYSPDYGVFVAWEASLHATFGYSSTVQVREALLQYANGFGWAVAYPAGLAGALKCR